ncbi:hypothetical protein [Kocuria marina]|uniref:hypothetical protein n=1 Tax=Kocuria marina TaxID=223184 RepID=UPI0021B58C8F|nr:hypothetical protein [Kocuria indica]
MPRTVEEILAHADELAARFEQYDPRPEDELDVDAITVYVRPLPNSPLQNVTSSTTCARLATLVCRGH